MPNADSLTILSDLENTLLGLTQRDFPLVPRPYAALAARLGCSEGAVLRSFRRLQDQNVVGRIGAVYRTGCIGASCLAAISVPSDQVETAAVAINRHPEVNHNYLRDHAVNLWFVVVAPDSETRHRVLAEIAADTGATVLTLPMVEGYHLDLGFALPGHG